MAPIELTNSQIYNSTSVQSFTDPSSMLFIEIHGPKWSHYQNLWHTIKTCDTQSTDIKTCGTPSKPVVHHHNLWYTIKTCGTQSNLWSYNDGFQGLRLYVHMGLHCQRCADVAHPVAPGLVIRYGWNWPANKHMQ